MASPRRRQASARQAAGFVSCLASLVTFALVAAAPSALAAPICSASGAQTICVTVPSSVLTGSQVVTVTNSPNSGELVFNWAANGKASILLMHRFGPSPETGDYSFVWPTQKYLDATGSIQVSVPGGTPVVVPNITLSNGNVSDFQHSPSDWQNYLPGAWTQPADPVVLATGDGPDDQAASNAVASMIDAADPPLFLFLGDVYARGTFTQMRNAYGVSALDDPTGATLWGRTADVTQPTAGNHEYPKEAVDWTDYWHGRPAWTSFTFGGVLFLDINTETSAGVGSAQYTYMQNALASAPACVATFGHKPPRNVDTINTNLQPLWQLISNNGGDLWLAGHVHTMSEYVPLDQNLQPGGHMVQLIVGSGGHSLGGTQSSSAVAWSKGKTTGALSLTLQGANSGGTASSLSWAFKSTAGTVLRTGSVGCDGASPPPPTISGFSPTSGPVGASVTIDGADLTGVTAVKFNATNATTFNVNGAGTQITATVPGGATTGKISVTTPGGTAQSSTDFSVTASGPLVSGFTPTSGPVGTSVAISGTGFTGASDVTFGGTSVGAGTFTVNSNTSITATVPATASTGPVCVTVSGNTGCSTTNFTVTIPGAIQRIGQIGTAINTSGATLNTLSLTVGSSVAQGDTVVVGVGAQANVSVVSVTDSRGNTYHVDALRQYTTGAKSTTALITAPVGTALQPGDIITVTLSKGDAWGFVAEDWSGITGLDQTGTSDSAGATTTTVSVSTSGATTSSPEVVFALTTTNAWPTLTPGSGYTALAGLQLQMGTAKRTLGLESAIVSSTGIQTGIFTLNVARDWGAVTGTYS